MRRDRTEPGTAETTKHATRARRRIRLAPLRWLVPIVGAMFAVACASTSQESSPVVSERVVAASPARVEAPAPPPPAAYTVLASGRAHPPVAVTTAVSPPTSVVATDNVVSTTQQAPTREGATPPAESRPGLATEWGERRSSPIDDVAFARADETKPLTTTELRYDDERGVAALAAYVDRQRPRGHETTAAWGAISIWLRDGNDRPLDFIQTKGHTFVVGEAGQRYTLILENHTSHRFEVVATVDGLDVMNGTPGSVDNRGYILTPYGTLEIDGFRDSKSTVAAFRFGRVGDSYAAKVGDARDVGVIGIAFFGERGDDWTPWRDDELRRRASATPFPGDAPPSARFAPPPWTLPWPSHSRSP
jgi:hypothetical protein